LALPLIAAFPALFSLDLLACSTHGAVADTEIILLYGEGNRDGSPVFDGDHPVTYFAGFDSNLLLPLPKLLFANGFEELIK